MLKPSQWTRLIERLGKIDNPTVRVEPSKSAIKAKTRRARTPDGRPAQLPLRAVGVRGPARAAARPLRRPPLRGRRGRTRSSSSPRPMPRAAARRRAPPAGTVPVTRVTVIDASPRRRRDRRGLAPPRRAPASPASSSAHRVSSADPGAPDPAAALRRPRRRRARARSWPRAPGRRRRSSPRARAAARRARRSKHRPAERLAALLSARDVVLACEELTLRARGDLDCGRHPEAALQLEAALAAALAELAGWVTARRPRRRA